VEAACTVCLTNGKLTPPTQNISTCRQYWRRTEYMWGENTC